MFSMTGFGIGERQKEEYSIKIQMKSVNHKFLDIKIRGTGDQMALESLIKDRLNKEFSRGHIDVYVDIEYILQESLELDEEYLATVQEIYERAGKLVGKEETISLPWLLNQKGVMIKKDQSVEEEDFKKDFEEALSDAVNGLKEMRRVEGESLQKDLEEKLKILQEIVLRTEKKTQWTQEESKAILRERIEELLGEYSMDESRFATEVALLMDKISIEEEIVRLSSHIDQFNGIMNSIEPKGRKLDFLLQEMNREANTMGSKARDIEILHDVVEMKTYIENLREQVQNLE
ncbi:YicC family protein [Peptoniphilus sp. KCTC 25270]|uniref:YicC/YloC family endoribonuclease n=1 Tax=Peptoniphilus sp. KCTC 25270 TaxID=2897414 RepID=UPI001E2CE38C|nr:YicC/YloC family endoribonuclease [Peptoniphilus sp. KCTC 25270]MCD1147121.1 YicC family protein [Peptoniphilus sp. KCTC 25270]